MLTNIPAVRTIPYSHRNQRRKKIRYGAASTPNVTAVSRGNMTQKDKQSYVSRKSGDLVSRPCPRDSRVCPSSRETRFSAQPTGPTSLRAASQESSQAVKKGSNKKLPARSIVSLSSSKKASAASFV